STLLPYTTLFRSGSETDVFSYFKNGIKFSGISYLGNTSTLSFSPGIYIKTNIDAGGVSFALRVWGGGNTSQVNEIKVSGYQASSIDGSPNTFKAVSLNNIFGKVDYVVEDGKICFWIEFNSNVSSFSPKVELSTGYNALKRYRITSVEPMVEPVEGTGNVTTVYSVNPKILAYENDLHSPVTLTGGNYLSLSGQEITASKISQANLSSTLSNKVDHG